MKLDRSATLALVVAIGALVVGCKPKASETVEDNSPEPAATVDEPDASAAPTSPGVTQGEGGERLDRAAPPPVRAEVPGDAPAPRYVWQQGYWRWDAGRSLYVWVDVFWADPDAPAPSAPPPPRVEDPGVAPQGGQRGGPPHP